MSSWWWLLRNDLLYSVALMFGRWSFKEGVLQSLLTGFPAKSPTSSGTLVQSIKNWMGPYQRTPKEVARAMRFSGLGSVQWVLLEISWIQMIVMFFFGIVRPASRWAAVMLSACLKSSHLHQLAEMIARASGLLCEKGHCFILLHFLQGLFPPGN